MLRNDINPSVNSQHNIMFFLWRKVSNYTMRSEKVDKHHEDNNDNNERDHSTIIRVLLVTRELMS
jgi:hypothetical protein